MSATSAVIYAQSLAPMIPLIPGVVALLALFAALHIWGINDSANVALGMYVLHVATLALLVVASVVYAVGNGGGYLSENFRAALPNVSNLEGTADVYPGNIATALFFGG